MYIVLKESHLKICSYSTWTINHEARCFLCSARFLYTTASPCTVDANASVALPKQLYLVTIFIDMYAC